MKTLLTLLLAAAAALAAESVHTEIRGTAKDSPIAGSASFEDTDKGLKVTAELSSVPPGPHAIHIHEKGSCGDMGKAAGDHYNPRRAKHGLVTRDGLDKAHGGDMGNVTVGRDGKARFEILIPGLTVSGENGVSGREIELH